MTKQNNGWVSTKERLPEEGETVLIAVRKGGIYHVSTVSYQKYFDEMKWVALNYDLYGIEDLVIDLHTASFWQPLPQLPKEE